MGSKRRDKTFQPYEWCVDFVESHHDIITVFWIFACLLEIQVDTIIYSIFTGRSKNIGDGSKWSVVRLVYQTLP